MKTVKVPRVELIINNTEDVPCTPLNGVQMYSLYPYIAEKLCKYPSEHSFVIYSDAGNVPICFMEIGIGNIGSTPIEARTILQGALSCNASQIVLFHNHPTGDLHPSEQDIQLTDCLIKTCRIFNMYLMDHVIVGNDKDAKRQKSYYSIKSKQYHRLFPKDLERLDLKGCTKYEGMLVFDPSDKAVEKYAGLDFMNQQGVYSTRNVDIDEWLAEKDRFFK